MFSVKSAACVAALGLGSLLIGSPGLAFETARTAVVSATTDLVSAPLPAAVSVTPLPATPAATDALDAPKGDARIVDAGDTAGSSTAFVSLAAAVAAQTMPERMDDDLRCLAGAIYYESKGEPLSGQLAVADVIINRTQSGRFPRTVCGVVTQPGQFSFVRGGDVPDAPNNAAYRTAVAVAQLALADGWDSEASDALYFHARRVSPEWRRPRVAAIGNHVFYR